jgi:hypothetical protein
MNWLSCVRINPMKISTKLDLLFKAENLDREHTRKQIRLLLRQWNSDEIYRETFEKARSSYKLLIFSYFCFTKWQNVCGEILCYFTEPSRELTGFLKLLAHLHCISMFRSPALRHVTAEILWRDCVRGIGMDSFRFVSLPHPTEHTTHTSYYITLQISCFAFWD